MKIPLVESKIWLHKDEIAIEKTNNPHQTAVGGKILFGDIVSRNGRHYVAEEVEQATNTLFGKPINVNHNSQRIIGHVQRAKYLNGTLEFWGLITNKTYAERVKANDPDFKGWSVQADYFCNKCPKCNERFMTPESFKQHMAEVEHIKNFEWYPEGIVFNGLAYVEGKEEPGVVGTTKDFAETLQFFETVSKDKEEECEWRNKMIENKKVSAAISEEKPSQIAVGVGQPSIEPSHETKIRIERGITTAVLPDDVTLSASILIPPVETPKPQVTEVKPEPTPQEHPDKFGRVDLLPKVISEGTLTETPKPLKLTEGVAPQPQTLKIKEALDIGKLSLSEFANAPKLKLGEPFAGYDDFADCVAKNQDKSNPEAYCGSIKHEVEGETYFRTRTVEAVNKVIDEINKSIEVQVPAVDNSWQTQIAQITEYINQLPKDDLSWKSELTSWKEQINRISDNLQTKFTTEMNTVKESIPKDDLSWKEELKTLKESIADKDKKHEEELKILKETMQQKYDESTNKVLAKVEEYSTATKNIIADLKKTNEEQGKELKETKNELQEVKATAENALDGVKPRFKGRNKQAETQSTTPVTSDPMKGAR